MLRAATQKQELESALPFQPDIGPAARQYQRKGKLLDNLDAHGKRKQQELQLRAAVRRAQAMEGCTFHPHVTEKSKQIASSRRDASKSLTASYRSALLSCHRTFLRTLISPAIHRTLMWLKTRAERRSRCTSASSLTRPRLRLSLELTQSSYLMAPFSRNHVVWMQPRPWHVTGSNSG